MSVPSEEESKAARAASVERQLEGEDPPKEPPKNEPGGSKPAAGTEDVGESVTRRGEDIADKDGTEPGRVDTGTEGSAERPTGASTERDATGLDT